jgi:hypothetical protein
MMNSKLLQDAIALAKQRWARFHTFDLDDNTWFQLFSTHRPGCVMQAITLSRNAKDADPARRFQYFERILSDLENQQSGQQY